MVLRTALREKARSTGAVEPDFATVSTNGEPRNPVKGRVVYLSGGMSGYSNYNFPVFNAAAEKLRELGASVINPAEGGHGGPWEGYLAHDIPDVCYSDALVVLPGWRRSRGATLEVMLAATLGKPVLHYPSLKKVKDLYAFKWVTKPRGLR